MKLYLEEAERVMEALETSVQGLSSAEASRRLAKYGFNRLAEQKKKPLWLRFLQQIANPMVLVLVAAAAISAVFGEVVDAAVIGVVVFLNAALGVFQENKAENAIEALKRMTAPCSRVRRDGRVMEVKAEELVPGDIVLLEAGDAVPADMRLI